MTDVLARVLAALDAGDGFALSALDDATLAAAWAACDRAMWLCRLDERLNGAASLMSWGTWVRHARATGCACDEDPGRGWYAEAKPPCASCAGAVRTDIGRPPTAAEVRGAARRPR